MKSGRFSEIGAVTRELLDSVLGVWKAKSRRVSVRAPIELAMGPRAIWRTITLKFLGNLPQVRELLQTDADAAYNGDPAAFSEKK